MKKLTVSEDTEVVLDGKKFLLEAGDSVTLPDGRQVGDKKFEVEFSNGKTYQLPINYTDQDGYAVGVQHFLGLFKRINSWLNADSSIRITKTRTL